MRISLKKKSAPKIAHTMRTYTYRQWGQEEKKNQAYYIT